MTASRPIATKRFSCGIACLPQHYFTGRRPGGASVLIFWFVSGLLRILIIERPNAMLGMIGRLQIANCRTSNTPLLRMTSRVEWPSCGDSSVHTGSCRAHIDASVESLRRNINDPPRIMNQRTVAHGLLLLLLLLLLLEAECGVATGSCCCRGCCLRPALQPGPDCAMKSWSQQSLPVLRPELGSCAPGAECARSTFPFLHYDQSVELPPSPLRTQPASLSM